MSKEETPLQCEKCKDDIPKRQAHLILKDSIAGYVCRECYINIYHKDNNKDDTNYK